MGRQIQGKLLVHSSLLLRLLQHRTRSHSETINGATFTRTTRHRTCLMMVRKALTMFQLLQIRCTILKYSPSFLSKMRSIPWIFHCYLRDGASPINLSEIDVAGSGNMPTMYSVLRVNDTGCASIATRTRLLIVSNRIGTMMVQLAINRNILQSATK